MENVVNGCYQTVEQRVDEMRVGQQCKNIFMEVLVRRREQNTWEVNVKYNGAMACL